MFPTESRTLKYPENLRIRKTHINDNHVRQLNSYVRRLRKKRGIHAVPWFDPYDGGINAKILFVLESPGGRSAGRKSSSGFVSSDNNDGTAKNFFEFRKKARLQRNDTVIWNIVPWYVGSTKKLQHVNAKDKIEGSKELIRLLKHVPKVCVIVLLGKTAQQTYEKHCKTTITRPLQVLFSPHPSPQYVNGSPNNKMNIIRVFSRAKKIIHNK